MPMRATLPIVLLLLAAIVHADEPKHSSSAAAAQTEEPSNAGEDALRALHIAMLRGLDQVHELDLSGNADRDFATVMIHHCKLAISLARTQLEHSKDSAVRERAQSVIAENEQEIVALEKLESELATRT